MCSSVLKRNISSEEFSHLFYPSFTKIITIIIMCFLLSETIQNNIYIYINVQVSWS